MRTAAIVILLIVPMLTLCSLLIVALCRAAAGRLHRDSFRESVRAARRFRTVHLVAMVALILPLAGCQQVQALFHGPAGDYVTADAATYDVIAPDHGKYVDADATMSDEQKARRHRTLDTWRLRIEQNGGKVSATQPSQ